VHVDVVGRLFGPPVVLVLLVVAVLAVSLISVKVKVK